jgi:autotransporter-associated beta strand protein
VIAQIPTLFERGFFVNRDLILLTWVVVAIGLAAPSAANAQTYYWSAGTGGTGTPGTVTDGAGGTGTWDSTNSFWWTLSGPGPLTPWVNGASSFASFGGTSGTVTLNELGITAGGLTFTTGGYTLAGSAANFLLLSGTPAVTLLNGVNTTISAVLSSSVDTTFATGYGATLTLSGNNTFTASVNLNGLGIVKITNSISLGTTNTINLNSGTLQIAAVTATPALNMANGTTLLGTGATFYTSTTNPVIANGATVNLATLIANDTLTIGSGLSNAAGSTTTPTVIINTTGLGSVSLIQSMTGFRANWVVKSGTFRVTTFPGSFGSADTSGGLTGSTLTLASGGNLTSTLNLNLLNSQTFDDGGVTRIPVNVTGNAIINFSKGTTGPGVTATFGTLNLGAPQLSITNATSVNSGTSVLQFTGQTILSGNPVFSVGASGAGVSTLLDLPGLNGGGIARGINKIGGGNATTLGGVLQISSDSNLADGTQIYLGAVTGSILRVGSSGALGTLSRLVNTDPVGGLGVGTLDLSANLTIGGIYAPNGGSNSSYMIISLNANTMTVGTTNNLSSRFAANINGAGGITKEGTGTFVYQKNTVGYTGALYSGPTTVNAGTMLLEDTFVLPNSSVIVNSGGGFGASTPTTNSTATVTNNVTYNGGSNAVFRGPFSTTAPQLAINGTLTTNGTVTLNLLQTSATNNPLVAGNSYKLMTYVGGSTPVFTVGTILNRRTAGATIDTSIAGQVNLSITGGGFLVWAGATGAIWDNSTSSLWTLNQTGTAADTSTLFTNGDTVNFPSATKIVNITTPVSPTVVNIGNNYSFVSSNGGISGPALVNVTGTGVTMNGLNSYTGVTTISGALSVDTLANGGQPSSIGAASADAFNLLLTSSNTFTYTGPSTSTNRGMIFSNIPTIAVSNPATRLELSGTILAPGNLGFNFAGPGTLRLSGLNSYGGTTTINGGTVEVTTFPNVNTVGSLGVGNGITINNNAMLSYIGSGNYTNHNFSVGITGGTLASNGTGPLIFTVAISLALGSTAAGARTLTLDGTNTQNNLITIIPDLTGATTVVKNGVGTWILAGANTYTGPTTVNSGTLTVTGSLVAGSAVTIAGGTLGGTGTVNGTVSVNTGGSIAPGNGGVGTLTVGSTTLVAGGKYELEYIINAVNVGVAGTTHDLLKGTTGSTLNLGGLSPSNQFTLNLTALGSGTPPGAPVTYTFAQFDSITGASAGDVTSLFNVTGAFTGSPSINFNLGSPNSLSITFTPLAAAVPEPIAILGLAAFALGITARIRRSRAERVLP